MIRRLPFVTLLSCLLLTATVPASAATDDNVPGDPIPASGTLVSVSADSDTDDVFNVWLAEGETIVASISPVSGDADPVLALYPPDTTDIRDVNHADYLVCSPESVWPRSIAYTARSAGRYYLDVYQSPLTPGLSGTVALHWSVSHPVYRFYNTRLGTHFYTATEAEKSQVIATLSDRYLFEGPAYTTNPYRNGAPLYRFFRPSTGTHFYTANEAEKNNVLANLGYLYSYDGPAYNVSLVEVSGSFPVWRFYNVRNGTHFYTSNASERDNVIANLGGTYRFEGPAFFVAQ